MSNYKTLVIVNPHSANGATGKKIDYIKKLLSETGSFEMEFTEASTHATILTQSGLKRGFTRIIAIGGDGTFNEVVNGFFENNTPINPDAVLGFISGGTGADFIKSIGIPKDWQGAIKRIKNNEVKKIDIGMVTFQTYNNITKSRYFLNIAGAGIQGAIVERVNNTTKLFGGFASFLIGTLSMVMDYKNQKTEINFDDEFKIEKVTKNIIVGNAKYFGGGMKILPDADLSDGFLDVLVLGDMSKTEFFQNISKVYSGTHLDNPKCDLRRAKKIYVNSDSKLLLDIDGEQEGYTPATFTIVPSAINIVC